MTTHRLTLSKRWVVPPIWKLWPLTEVSPSFAQTLLHWSRNQVLFISAQDPSDILNAKMGAVTGMRELDDRWCSKAVMVLQLQVESDMIILAPFSLVFVQGMRKLMHL